MSGLVREVLADYAQGQLPVEDKVDIEQLLKHVVRTGLMTRKALEHLLFYSNGYTPGEIAKLCSSDYDEVVANIIGGLLTLEEHSDYKDAQLIDKVSTEHLSRNRTREMRTYLDTLGKDL